MWEELDELPDYASEDLRELRESWIEYNKHDSGPYTVSGIARIQSYGDYPY